MYDTYEEAEDASVQVMLDDPTIKQSTIYMVDNKFVIEYKR
jgi:hypothetical protein